MCESIALIVHHLQTSPYKNNNTFGPNSYTVQAIAHQHPRGKHNKTNRPQYFWGAALTPCAFFWTVKLRQWVWRILLGERRVQNCFKKGEEKGKCKFLEGNIFAGSIKKYSLRWSFGDGISTLQAMGKYNTPSWRGIPWLSWEADLNKAEEIEGIWVDP